MYNRHVFYHELGTDPETDTKIFGEGRDPEDWPSVSLDNDGRLLLITVSAGLDQDRTVPDGSEKGHATHAHHHGKEFSL